MLAFDKRQIEVRGRVFWSILGKIGYEILVFVPAEEKYGFTAENKSEARRAVRVNRVCWRHHRLQGVEGRQADKPRKRTDVVLSMVCVSFFLSCGPWIVFGVPVGLPVHAYQGSS
ncbi:unnamed protein product, partial [Ectocarpus sp. 12 AP-2014]